MYATGTINAATPAASMFTSIETMLGATGYVLVDTWAPTTTGGTDTYRVWRNPAANNQSGVDWYLVLGRASDTATQIMVLLGEGYVAASHTLSKCAQASSSTSRTADADTTNAVTAVINAPPATILRMTVNLGSAGFWLSVTQQRVILATAGAMPAAGNAVGVGTSSASPLLYAGCFDTLVPSTVSRDTGLGLGGLQQQVGTTTPSVGLGTTREPGLSGATVSALVWQASVSSSGTIGTLTPAFGTEGYTGRPLGARLLLAGRATSNANSGGTFMRGLAKDMLMIPIAGVVASQGDEVELTIDTVTGNWVAVYVNSATWAFYLNELA